MALRLYFHVDMPIIRRELKGAKSNAGLVFFLSKLYRLKVESKSFTDL